MEKTVDIAVLGATGFTGQFVVNSLLQHEQAVGKRICAAARSMDRLQQKQRDLWQKHKTHENLELAIADVSDWEALLDLARRSRVLINCVGPFDLTGDLVVRACLEGHCEYCDITGEPRYIRHLISTFHDMATERSLRVVPAVGIDSIPADLGTLFVLHQFPTQDKFWEQSDSNGEDKELYVNVTNNVRMKLGDGVSGGTYHTLINSFQKHSADKRSKQRSESAQSEAGSSSSTRRRRAKKRLPKWPTWCKELDSYIVPFPTSDPTVVARSRDLDQYFLDGRVDFEFGNYLQLKKLWYVIVFMVAALLFSIAATFRIGRAVLARLWRKQGEGPTERDDLIRFDLIGQCNSTRGLHKVHAVVYSGPAYRATGDLAAETALFMLETSESGKCGVLSPASAFGTELIDRLHDAGVLRFRVKSASFQGNDDGDAEVEREVKKLVRMG